MTGIQINLISREKLAAMSPEQRVRFIVDEIKAGKVLVLERGLTAKEELELIRVTMAEIDHKSFIGVETPGFSIDLKKRGFMNRLFGSAPPPRMMVVGPAQMLQTIKKDGEMVQTMIVTKDSMGKMSLENVLDQQKASESNKGELPAEPDDKPLPAPPPDAIGKAPPPPEPSGDKAQGAAPKAPPPEDKDQHAELASPQTPPDARPAPTNGQHGPPNGQPEPHKDHGVGAPAQGEPKPAGQPPGAPMQGQVAKKPPQYHSLSDYPEEPHEMVDEKDTKGGA